MPDSDVLCVVPAGPPSDPAVAVMPVWALTLITNVYVGIAERAMELAVADAARRTSIAIPRGTFAHHPCAAPGRRHVPGTGRRPLLRRRVASGLGQRGRPRTDVGPEGARRQVAGHGRREPGRRPRLRGERRLVVPPRDGAGAAVPRRPRAARFHPGTDAFTHETVGKALLGVDGDGARW